MKKTPAEIYEIRKDFPMLNSKFYDKPLIYFDNAATTLKPKVVISAIKKFYSKNYGSNHSSNFLGIKVRQQVEACRKEVKNFLNLPSNYEIVFTSGATEGANLVAAGFADFIKSPSILSTSLEHHSNLLPVRKAAERLGYKFFTVKLNKTQTDLDYSQLYLELKKQPGLMAVTWVSNSLGVKVKIDEIIKKCQKNKIFSLVDCTQAVGHFAINFKLNPPDFCFFSGHKLFGPTGIGVLAGRTELLNKITPYKFGGDMVDEVTQFTEKYKSAPEKFEAGTQNLAGIVGLLAAIKYLKKVRKKINLEEYEHQLKDYLFQKLKQFKNLEIYSPKNSDIPIISFKVKGQNDFDLGAFFNLNGVALRVGKHCTGPLFEELGINSTIRISLSFYNTFEEIDSFIHILKKIVSKS